MAKIKKSVASDEIDLIEALLVVWQKKWIVVIIIVLSLLAVFIDQHFTRERIEIRAITEIRPIKTVDEASYQIFNNVLKSIKPAQSIETSVSKYKEEGLGNVIGNSDTFLQIDEVLIPNKSRNIKNLNINNINKDFLYDLFIEIINEKPSLRTEVKQFNLIKKENYPNKLEYEQAIDELISSIRLTNLKDLDNRNKKKVFRNDTSGVVIEIVTIDLDLEEWEVFLKFLEEQVNLKIQSKITKVFDDYVNYLEIIRKFEIQDLEVKLLTLKQDSKKLILRRNIDILKSDNYADKIQNIFDSSPVSDRERFYAARIVSDSTHYSKYGKKASLKTLIASTISIGGILGIFFVLIMSRIQRRR